MRAVIAIAVSVAALLGPSVLRGCLATGAAALFEATPFLFAGWFLERFARGRLAAYAGCGCGPGPSARSLPAAVAAWVVFGPAVALARIAAAVAIDAWLHRRTHVPCEGSETSPLDALRALVPSAALAGAAAQFGAPLFAQAKAPFAAAAAGAALAFTASPCGLATVALAGAMHVRSPIMATAFLCVAGIVDARALGSARHRGARGPGHDAFAYALLAAGLATVAARAGDALVHPAFAMPLAGAATVAAAGTVWHRRSSELRARTAPALMLLGALVAAPPPEYRATETTMAGVFAGERLDFTGVLVGDARGWALVRYAVTCCRADAAPVVVRLARRPDLRVGTWLRAWGTIETVAGMTRLRTNRLAPVSPPADPFVYR